MENKVKVEFEGEIDAVEVEKELKQLMSKGDNLGKAVEQLFADGDQQPQQEVDITKLKNEKMQVYTQDCGGVCSQEAKIVKILPPAGEPLYKNENYNPDAPQVRIELKPLTASEKKEYVKVQQSEAYFAEKAGSEAPPTLFDDVLPVLEKVGKVESVDKEITVETQKLISDEMEKRGFVDRSHEVKDNSTTLFQEEDVLKMEKDIQFEIALQYGSELPFEYQEAYCFQPINIADHFQVPVDFDCSFYKHSQCRFTEMVFCTGSFSYVFDNEKRENIDNLLVVYKALAKPEKEDVQWLFGRIASKSEFVIVNKSKLLKNIKEKILYLRPVNLFTTEFLIHQIDFLLSNIQKDYQEDAKEDATYLDLLGFINREMETLRGKEFDSLPEEYDYKLVILRKFPRG